MYTREFFEKSGWSTTSCNPPCPCTVTRGRPAIGCGSSLPLLIMRSRPAFSVTSMRPSGRTASDQGCSRPFTIWTTRNECSSDLYVWARLDALTRSAKRSRSRMRRFYNSWMPSSRLLALVCAFVSSAVLAQVAQYDQPDREQFLLQGARKEGEVMIYTS